MREFIIHYIKVPTADNLIREGDVHLYATDYQHVREILRTLGVGAVITSIKPAKSRVAS